MNFGSKRVYLYDYSDEEYISGDELSHGIELSANLSNEEPRPKPRPLPGRSHRSTNPPLREETPQLITAEEVSKGLCTKYLSYQHSDDNNGDEREYGRESAPKDKPFKQSEGASATPATAMPLSEPPVGILKKKPKKRYAGGMVQWMSWQDTDNFKYILEKFQPTLAEGISLPDLLPQLHHRHLLTDEENEVLLDGKLTHKERVLKLLSFVEKKNTILYHSFLHALEDETNHPQHQVLAEMLKKATEKQQQQQRGFRSRQVDTNILAVRFDTLSGRGNIHTGDVVVCNNQECTAVLSHLSKITGEPDADKKVWVCEFCGTKNEVDIVAEEMPASEEITYLLTPPVASSGAESATPTSGMQESLLVFCIDTSGSMCVTTEVAGRVKLKSDEKLRRLSVSLKAEIETQYMPRQSRNVTYVSRLQSVQSAIDEQLTSLVNSKPSQRVALVTFSDEVIVVGDGQTEGVVVAGDKLFSVEALLRIGDELPLPSSVSRSKDALAQKVNTLEDCGQTALGPALLLSVLLAGQVSGSKVIVCTDGLANTGLGSFDEIKSEEAFSGAQQFYKDLGDIALEKGVTVSVVTIKGEECRVMELGQVADATGGNVTRVDPSTVASEFSNIVSNPVIATNVACKLILHNRLYFRTEGVKGNVMCVPVGNVTADTEFSLEYGVKRLKLTSQKQSSGANKDVHYDSVDAQQILDKDNVTDVLEEILSIKCLYFPLGECLRLASKNLKAIRKAYPDESDADKALKAVILLWLKKKYKVAKFGLPTWKMLVEAVEKKTGGNNPMLAKEIASKHPTALTPDHVREMLDVAWKYRAKWRFIGIALGFDTGTLDAIEHDKRKAEDCLSELISQWLRWSDPRPTRKAMAEALASPSVAASPAALEDTPTVVESSSTPPLILQGKPHLPFQLQTEFTTTDGSVLLRVITKVKPVTEDRELAEKDIDMDVMGFHVLRTSANLAAEGKFTEARTGAIASQRMMKRSLERDSNTIKRDSYSRTVSSIAPLERKLREKQRCVASMPVTRDDTDTRKCSLSTPLKQPSEPALMSAFKRRCQSNPATCRASMSSMPGFESALRSPRVRSVPIVSVTTKTEAKDLLMGSEDSLAAEIYRVKRRSSSRSVT